MYFVNCITDDGLFETYWTSRIKPIIIKVITLSNKKIFPILREKRNRICSFRLISVFGRSKRKTEGGSGGVSSGTSDYISLGTLLFVRCFYTPSHLPLIEVESGKVGV